MSWIDVMQVREAAYKILCETLLENSFASLNMRYGEYGLNESDQGLLTQIVYGTLRNFSYVRYQWQLYVEGDVPKKIAVLLDMSAYQLLCLDKIPAYACVNDAVDIAKKLNGGQFAGLVNAVLRKIADKGPQKVTAENDFAKLAIETAHPEWLLKMWSVHYGQETMEKIAWEDLKEARVALRCNTLLTSEDVLLQDSRFHKGKVEGSLYFDGNILNTGYYRENIVIVQSESSQKVVEVLNPVPGQRILDMCASPGTKSIQMAMKVKNNATIYSVDVYPQRVELIEDACRKYGITCIKTMCMDARQLLSEIPAYYFDQVLLDAPCSGLGTLKHKPEIKLNLKPGDIDDIVKLQSQLLDSAALMVKKDGYLTYSTCTLNRKENEKQIEMFVSQHPEFEVIYEKTIFPFEDGSDGFYISKLHRIVLE